MIAPLQGPASSHLGVRRRDGMQGQGLVEFALVFPIFIAILFGLIDGARFVYAGTVVSQAAREGARLASVEAFWLGSTDSSCGAIGGPVCPPTVSGSSSSLEQDVIRAVNRMVAGLGSIDQVHIRCTKPGSEPNGSWTGVTCADHDIGDVVSLRIVYTYRGITPLVSAMMGPVERSAAASMVIN